MSQPGPDEAAMIARHLPGVLPEQPAARIESDPPGATVYLDLVPVGQTPIDLPPRRAPDAPLDVELGGHRKLHRDAAPAGTLAVSLVREDPLVALADAAHGWQPTDKDLESPPERLAQLGRRTGAARLIVLRAKEGGAEARLLDVGANAWMKPPLGVAAGGSQAEWEARAGEIVKWASSTGIAAALAAHKLAAPPAGVAQVPSPRAVALVTANPAGEGKPQATVPAWKKWYTWVAVAGVGALLGGLWALQHYGSDEVTVHVTH
jgi:hypothetical protein